MPAKDIYRSPWFNLARARVEHEAAPWYILSAKHGLLHPDTEIAPYDVTLNTMGVVQRRHWAARVKSQMDEILPNADEVVILAGLRFREYLDKYLRSRFFSVTVPMEGLRIGQQLRWLPKSTAGGIGSPDPRYRVQLRRGVTLSSQRAK